MKRQEDNIGHTAHFGGALGGILCTLIFDPYVFEKSFETLVIMSIVTIGAALFLFRQR